ncbi:amidohydrolase [Eubacteriales bacterium OttesenSCG-928-M02]|nr:amidohydrolase [Eubacteriales bacterium OttesenSCG-928-M02]
MDTIYYNGKIYSPAYGEATAISILGDRIHDIGTDDAILSTKTPDTLLINLRGASVLPGFVDSHCHLLSTGITDSYLDLRGATSPDEIIARGKAYLSTRHVPPGQWIVGFGFNQNTFVDPILPTKEIADAISTQHPILLNRVCNHVGTANSMALAQLGFDENTHISGGVLDVGTDGALNGILREAALTKARNSIPPPDKAEMVEILKTTMAHMNAAGITAVHTNDGNALQLPAFLDAFSQLEQDGSATLRVYEEVSCPDMPLLNAFLGAGWRNHASPYLKIGNVKMLADGSLGARTAYMLEPYADDPTSKGVALYTDAELDELVLTAHKNGMQLAIHAIGDGALEQALNALEKAQTAHPEQNLRHRIVHCQIGSPSQYQRMAALGLCADIQPPFVPTDSPILEARVGTERAFTSYAWKTLMDLGIPLGGGSDSPIEPFDPLYGIYCAVSGKGRWKQLPGGWLPQEELYVYQSIHLYTAGPAYLSFQENHVGTLAPGMLADFVILNRHLPDVPLAEYILKAKVLATIVGGKEVYRA